MHFAGGPAAGSALVVGHRAPRVVENQRAAPVFFLITTPKPAQPAPHAAPCAPPRYAPLHRPARLSPVSGSRVRAQRTAACRSRGARAVGIEMMRHMASSHANTAHASREGGRAGAFQCTRRAQHWRAGTLVPSRHLVSSHRRTRAVGPARPHAATRGRHREGSREEREGSIKRRLTRRRASRSALPLPAPDERETETEAPYTSVLWARSSSKTHERRTQCCSSLYFSLLLGAVGLGDRIHHGRADRDRRADAFVQVHAL